MTLRTDLKSLDDKTGCAAAVREESHIDGFFQN